MGVREPKGKGVFCVKARSQKGYCFGRITYQPSSPALCGQPNFHREKWVARTSRERTLWVWCEDKNLALAREEIMKRARLALLCAAVLALTATPATAAVKVVKKTITAHAKTYSISIEYPVTGVKAIDDVLAKYAKDQADDDKDADGGDPDTHN